LAEGEEVVRFDIADEFSARRTCQSTLRIGRATAIAPAVFKRCTTRASLSGRQSLNFRIAPSGWQTGDVELLPLPVTGNPSSGLRSPRASAASAAAAVVRARSKSRTTTALILGSSASIRAIAASSNSRAETVRSMRAALSSCGRRMSDPRPPPLGHLVADHPQPRPQTQSGRYVGWGRWSSKPLPPFFGSTRLPTDRLVAGYAISNNPAAPMPPPTHIVTTTYLAPRRFPSISACPVMRAPDMP
jgi:hypothetical protein